MRLLLLLFLLFILGCGPKCINGHYEYKIEPAHYEDRIVCFDPLIMVPVYVPERQVPYWVCDQYEVEKNE